MILQRRRYLSQRKEFLNEIRQLKELKKKNYLSKPKGRVRKMRIETRRSVSGELLRKMAVIHKILRITLKNNF